MKSKIITELDFLQLQVNTTYDLLQLAALDIDKSKKGVPVKVIKFQRNGSTVERWIDAYGFPAPNPNIKQAIEQTLNNIFNEVRQDISERLNFLSTQINGYHEFRSKKIAQYPINTLVTEEINPFKHPIAFTFFQIFFPGTIIRTLTESLSAIKNKDFQEVVEAINNIYKKSKNAFNDILTSIKNNTFDKAIKESLKDITPGKIIALGIISLAIPILLATVATIVLGALEFIPTIIGLQSGEAAIANLVNTGTIALKGTLETKYIMSMFCLFSLTDAIKSVSRKFQQINTINQVNTEIKKIIPSDIKAKRELNKLINNLSEEEILNLIGLNYYKQYANIPGVISILKDFKKRLASNMQPGNLLSDNLDIFKKVRAMVKEDIDKYLDENKEEVNQVITSKNIKS